MSKCRMFLYENSTISQCIMLTIVKKTKGENIMADIRPFKAVRPCVELADKIAALP